MARKSKAKFEMEGHTLPGINQKSETANKKDGRSPSSAFQQKSSPNKILGAIAGASMLAKGVGNLFSRNEEEEESTELLEGTGKTIEPVQGFKVSGGDEDVVTTGTVPPITEPDEVLTMKSPTKKN